MPPIEKRAKRATKSAGAARRPRRPAQQGKPLSPACVTLTPIQSTKISGFGIQATYRMLRDGTMPCIKVGMRFFIPRNALLNWLETCAKPLAQ